MVFEKFVQKTQESTLDATNSELQEEVHLSHFILLLNFSY